MDSFAMNERKDHVEVEFDRGIVVSCGFDYDRIMVSADEYDEYGLIRRAEYNYEINLYDVEGVDEDGDIGVTKTMEKAIIEKIQIRLSEDD